MEYIKQIAFFMVFTGIVLELTADTKYHKFSEWVVGILLILQIVKPWLTKDVVWEQFTYRLASFDYVLGGNETPGSLFAAEEDVERLVRLEYEKTLTAQIGKLLEANKLTLLSASYEMEEATGELQNITVTAEYQTSPEDSRTQIKVEQMEQVTPVTVGEEAAEEVPEVVTPMEVYVKQLLADFYGIPAEYISVKIQEEFLHGQ